MRIPDRLAPLVDLGVIQEVVRPLMSGKEAAVYLVESAGELRVAKVYKEASQRSFQHRADYTEGRRVRNSRQQRAMEKRSKFGREQIEAAWRSAEVDAIYKLRDAGVRVPEPFDFIDGVLVMELIRGWDGGPAPRLVDLDLSHDEAVELMNILLREVVKMLCAGVVHGDLSDFNVLVNDTGPVIIDFPQWVDPSHNTNARKLLVRDVDNLTQFLGRFAPELLRNRFGAEMWDLYEKGRLQPDTVLTGRYQGSRRQADVGRVIDEIQAAEREERRRCGEDVEEEEPQEQRPRRGKNSRRASVAAEFFADLEWRGAGSATKGPAARARELANQAPEPEPPRDRRPENRRRGPPRDGPQRDHRDQQARDPHPRDRQPHDRPPRDRQSHDRPPRDRPPEGREARDRHEPREQRPGGDGRPPREGPPRRRRRRRGPRGPRPDGAGNER